MPNPATSRPGRRWHWVPAADGNGMQDAKNALLPPWS